jgi:trigger factor
MKAVVEPLEGNKVKLTVQVDEQEFEKDIDAAFRKIAREVRVPGFRPGKAPRRILEARLGKETGRAEALRDALPGYYSRAVRDNEVDVVAPPEIDITAGEESGAVEFDAVVEVRPQLHLAGYGGLRVVVPSPIVTEEDIDAQVDRLRGNFGELTPVNRPAIDGDFLTVDLHGTRDGEAVPGLTTDDFLYEVGSGTVLNELDENLRGAKVGDILAFDADIPGENPVNLRVLVKEAKEKKLPEVTDDWASEASEFDTVEELRADIEKRMGLVKRVQSTLALRNAAIDALIELVDVDPPASLIDAEVERRVQDLNQRLEGQGATISEYLQASGQSPEQFVASLREGAVPAVKADLALRAVADGESLEPADQDIEDEIDRLAASYKMKSRDLRRSLERADQMPAVRSDWKKSKALEWLVEHVEIVDADGQPIDRALLEPDLNPPDTDSPDTDSPDTDSPDAESTGTDRPVTASSEGDSQDPETGEP